MSRTSYTISQEIDDGAAANLAAGAAVNSFGAAATVLSGLSETVSSLNLSNRRLQDALVIIIELSGC